MATGRLQFKHVDRFYESFEQIKTAIDASIERAERLGGTDELIPLYGEPVVYRYKDDGGLHLVLGVGDMSGLPEREDDSITPKYSLIDFDSINDGIVDLETLSGVVENVISGLGFDPIDGTIDNDTIKHLEYFDGEEQNVLNYILILHNKLKEAEGSIDELRINYNSDTKEIELINSSGSVISSFDASVFVKDGMLKEAHFVATYEDAERWDPDDHHTAQLPYLLLIWNTDSGKEDYTRMPMSSFYDVYVGVSGVTIDGFTVSAKIDPESEAFLTVNADGIRLLGVSDAISSARTDAIISAKTYTDSKVSEAVDSINDEIEALQNDINLNTEAIGNVQDDLEDFKEKTGTIQNRVLSDVVSGNTNDILVLDGRVDSIEDSIDNIEREKVDKVEGKSLSTNDFTNEYKSRLESAITGALANDPILSVSGSEISSSFSVEYDESAKKIFFYGKPNNKIGELDATKFVVDGLLDSVEVVTVEGKKYLRFNFITSSGIEVVDVLIDDLMEDIDEKIGEGFVDESGATISITHKINEMEDEFNEYINSESLKFNEDFKVAGIVGTLGTGKWKNGDTIPAGTSLMSVIKDILQQRLLPEGVLPSATISLKNSGSYEVGSVVSPSYEATFDSGMYKYADGTTGGTNISPSQIYVNTKINDDFGPETGDTLVGTLSPVVISEGMKLSVYTTISYTNHGYIPKDNLGNDAPEQQIQDGYVLDEEGRRTISSPEFITSYRPMFYGSLQDGEIIDYNHITSAEVLGLLTKSSRELIDRIPVEQNAEVVVIMIPVLSKWSIKKIIDTESGFDMMDVFVRHQAHIKTYPDEAYENTAYYVYVFDPGTQISENIYKIIYEHNE